jgi:hypothetical protein
VTMHVESAAVADYPRFTRVAADRVPARPSADPVVSPAPARKLAGRLKRHA